MSPEELLTQLLDVARETGLEVRTLSAGARAGPPELPEGFPAQGGLCRLRGRWWVLLLRSDPPERWIELLAAGLRRQAPDLLEGRFLPPALRECLEKAS